MLQCKCIPYDSRNRVSGDCTRASSSRPNARSAGVSSSGRYSDAPSSCPSVSVSAPQHKAFSTIQGPELFAALLPRPFPAGFFGQIHDFDCNLSLEVNVCETIGINLWHAPKVYERVERQLFCAALKPGYTVLDVGANVGIYTLLASKRGTRVVAVEADPANANVLRQSLERNGLADRVEIHQIAATDCPKVLTLHRNPFNSGGSSVYGDGESLRVLGRTIDSLGLPSIDVCKMDIEGSELAALRGMRETIKRSPQMKLLMECSRDQAELLEFLRERFKHINIVGTGELKHGHLPAYCNVWASN